ncbi:MAG: hypothetical protein ACI8RD_003536 [Bacillariaceae sp.]|jgi:hypothetical protein
MRKMQALKFYVLCPSLTVQNNRCGKRSETKSRGSESTMYSRIGGVKNKLERRQRKTYLCITRNKERITDNLPRHVEETSSVFMCNFTPVFEVSGDDTGIVGVVCKV